MANLLFQIKDIWIVWPGGIGLELITIEKLLDKHDHPITKGAVFDLAVPRDQFSENGTFSVNSQFEVSSNNHAIYSVIDLGPNPIFSQFSGFVGIVYNILFFIGDFTLDEIFDGDANDLVVSEPSQKGGLSSPQSKLFENEYHLGQKSNPQIIDWVEDLLEKPLDAAEFADFFSPTPLALSSQLASTQNRKVGKLLQESQIAETATFVAIISPDSGITVSSGQIVTVIAEGSEGEPLSKVLFFTSDTSYLDEEAPFEFDLQIPDKALGNYLIAVLGKDMGGGNSYDEISVNVEASALLDSIVVQPETVLLQIADQELGLYVQGYYSDGIKRNLSGSEKGTIYFSQNPAVVTVNAGGILKAVADGSTQVSVQNSGASDFVDVIVRIDTSYTPPQVPELRVEPEELDFGQLTVDSSKTTALTIFNDGQVTLNIESGVINDPIFSIIETFPLSIGIGGSQEIHVVFQPNEEAVYVSDIVLHSNDPAHLLRFIPLIGEGTTATGEVLAQPNCPPALVQNCPVTVPVSIDVSGTSPGTNLGSYNATLTWDPNLLAYVGFSGGNEPFDTPIVNEDNTATGELQFEQSDPTGAGSVATIINVEFNVVGDPATGGVLDLEFSEITAGTQNDLLSITTIEDCSFEIAPGCLLGDVTNDAASSGFDALVIATFAVDLPIPPQFLQRIEQGCGDVTLDGNTSGFDALVIATFAVDLPIPDEFPVGEPFCP